MAIVPRFDVRLRLRSSWAEVNCAGQHNQDIRWTSKYPLRLFSTFASQQLDISRTSSPTLSIRRSFWNNEVPTYTLFTFCFFYFLYLSSLHSLSSTRALHHSAIPRTYSTILYRYTKPTVSSLLSPSLKLSLTQNLPPQNLPLTLTSLHHHHLLRARVSAESQASQPSQSSPSQQA